MSAWEAHSNFLYLFILKIAVSPNDENQIKEKTMYKHDYANKLSYGSTF